MHNRVQQELFVYNMTYYFGSSTSNISQLDATTHNNIKVCDMIQPNLSSTLDDVSYITKSFLPILPTAMDDAMGDDDAPSTDMDSSSSSSTNVTKSPPGQKKLQP